MRRDRRPYRQVLAPDGGAVAGAAVTRRYSGTEEVSVLARTIVYGGRWLLDRRGTAWVVLALTLAVAACGTKHGRFYHQGHRKAYAIEDAELRRLQFYVSTKVLAHDLDAQGARSVILVEEGTPGVAVDSGPNWIRVRFQAGGEGVVFLAPTGGSDASYMLATEAEDGSGYRLVRNEPDRILRAGSRRYRIVSGSEAVLLVDAGDLTDLIEKERTHVGGQRRSK